MRLRQLFPVLLLLALIWPANLIAQSDEADVRQAVLNHYATIGSGDMDGTIQQHTDHFTGFLFDNGLLVDLQTRTDQNTAWAPLTAAGFAWNADIRHMQVVVRGDVAVAMFYATGTMTFPGQAPAASTRRVSEVWVKENGEWLELHHHDSPLLIEP
jgi:ketosteroid isomerase-like protein